MESLRHHWGFLDGTIDSGLALAATYAAAPLAGL